MINLIEESVKAAVLEAVAEAEQKANEPQSNIMKLSCKPKNYAWGKPAKTSKVAQLLSKENDDQHPYAELWMGTHKKGPSSVILDHESNQTQLLSEYIGEELPYLYKVLSVARSLSIQAHPDKQLAEKLHTAKPDIYPDDNHKPELAVALTQFEAMCGFRPSSQISFFLQNVPELSQIVGKQITTSFIQNQEDHKSLQYVFTAVMTANKNEVQKQINTLITRIKHHKIPSFEKNVKENAKFARNIDINELVLRLNNQFPGDVGIFAVFLLNCFRLKPGEAIFLGANVPHAYLDGDCIECMACSDNVVRAGLTPKLRDTPVLCQMLNYKARNPEIMTGSKIGANTWQYRAGAGFNEFRLDRTQLDRKYMKECLDINKIDGCLSEHASIILVYEGKGFINKMNVERGDCLLLAANVPQLNIENNDHSPLKLARCYTPLAYNSR